MNQHQPRRQVHLDFHTSPMIEGIGADFAPDAFVSTLREAHVDSITIFAKCHHGMAYYDTQVGVRHPHLEFDLMAAMLEALHGAGIRAPIYYSLGWDEHAVAAHPEWMLRDINGQSGNPPLGAGWKHLCFNTGYADYCAAMVEEIVDHYPVDGLFFDIVFISPCYCPKCLSDMVNAGLDPENADQARAFRVDVNRRFLERLYRIGVERHPGATVYFNSIPNFAMRPFADFQTHMEIECLPRGGWGYDFFPMCVRRMGLYDKPMLGMTGRFLEGWGQFGSMSPPASLAFETYSCLAHGIGCSIGDQLHPRGRLDAEVYELIGSVYERVEALEPWVVGSRPVVEMALLHTGTPGAGYHGFPEGDVGAMHMLLELHYQFDVIDTKCDFSRYKLLVLPDSLPCDATLASKLNDYTAQGGLLLASHHAGMNQEGNGFALDGLPVAWQGESPFSVEYLVAGEELVHALGRMPLAVYAGGTRVTAKDGASVTAWVGHPYFERAWDHFCSHAHTPYKETTEHPAIVVGKRGAYFAHPLFSLYRKHGFLVYRDAIYDALDSLLGPPLVQCDLPSAARVTLLRQDDRHVLHVLYYVPERRTPRFEMVEDVVALHDVEARVRLSRYPTRVYLAPEETELPFERDGDACVVRIPKVLGHAVVVFE